MQKQWEELDKVRQTEEEGKQQEEELQVFWWKRAQCRTNLQAGPLLSVAVGVELFLLIKAILLLQ